MSFNHGIINYIIYYKKVIKMNYKFIYIDSKENIEKEAPTIVDVFSALLQISKFQINQNSIILYYQDTYTSSISDIITNLVQDMYIDLRVYESRSYNSILEIDEDTDYVINEINKIPFYKSKYIDNKTLLNNNLNNITTNLKKLVLGNYYDNLEYLKTIKTFLTFNQNSTIASKELYIHRNTLNQRLDKFQIETGFNVKIFIDAYLIYHIL